MTEQQAPDAGSHEHDWHEQTLAMTRDRILVCTICHARRIERR